MDLVAISVWLKTTIPGIVLLGALGSAIAALAIWAARRLLLPLFKSFLLDSLKRLVEHFAKPATFSIVHFVLKNGDKNLPLFYALQIIKLVLALFVATCAFMLFALAITESSQPLARSAVLTPLIISFLSLWYGLRCVTVVLLPLYVDIFAHIEETKQKYLEEKAKANAR